MKKIIYFFGLTFLAIVIILNILFTADLDASEHITIHFNSVLYIIGVLATGLAIYFGAKMIEKQLAQKLEKSKEKEKVKKCILIIAIVIYAICNIVWVIAVRPNIVGDQSQVCNLAQAMYGKNVEEMLNSQSYAGNSLKEYIEAYHHQIPTAFIFHICYRITHIPEWGVLRVFNVISNVAMVVALYQITKQLSKTYQTNKVLLGILSFTFFTIPMFVTFVYGDIPSLPFCLFSVYFMMRYREEGSIKHVILASVFMMIAYMLRMNSLIFIIATVMYMLLNLFQGITKRKAKENILKIVMIVVYVIISMVPANLIKIYYLHKYELSTQKAYPSISYFLMAMEESPRGNGWYNEERGEYAQKNVEKAKEEYKEEIENRISYLSQNLDYTFHFYIDKITSMWAENTYSAVRNNTVQENDPLENIIGPLAFYQKALLIVTCVSCVIILIQNRKNLSLDVLLLITIFIGGFAFHILWEAKSRYILPYILVLIPVASIKLKGMKRSEIEYNNY